MANIAAEDYKVVLHYIYDSEEMKIDSAYASMIRPMIEELWSTSQRDKQFEQQYLKLLEVAQRIIKKATTGKKEEPFVCSCIWLKTCNLLWWSYFATRRIPSFGKCVVNKFANIADLYVHAWQHGSYEINGLYASQAHNIGCQNSGNLY